MTGKYYQFSDTILERLFNDDYLNGVEFNRGEEDIDCMSHVYEK